jgi:hypothetical protein
MNNIIAAIVVVIVVALAGYTAGSMNVQKKWDIEKARVETVAKESEKHNKEANDAIAKQHEKDISAAKTEAGRAAVRDWLKSHGVLPSGAPVRDKDCGAKSESTGAPVERSDTESIAGAGIERFALECARGAIMNMDWRDWAVRNNLQAE